ncbi:MAG: type VII secretion target [Actinomycetota bacterium]|nr:type VII secretion target [Actinomycetota bacterium]MDA2949654.1 type VII secretion target [Actinomycetota bacterium]
MTDHAKDPAGPVPSKIFEVDYRRLTDFAAAHDASAEEIAQWVQADPDFAERFLATHGKVAYGTYLKIKQYTDSRLVQGSIYAHRHASTAAALRNAVRIIDGVDSDNASRLAGGPTSTT